MTGAELVQLSDRDLDDIGVPFKCRKVIREELLGGGTAVEAARPSSRPASPASPTVDEQLAQADAQAQNLRTRLSKGASREEPADGEDAESDLRVHLLPRPPTPPTQKVMGGVTALAGGLAATSAFLAAERAKRAEGLRTTADTLQATGSPTAPYSWAAESQQFGMEWVKKVLEIGEGAPMVGAVFTLCLIIARSAEQALANKSACAELGYLARRVAMTLSAADKDNLRRAAQSVGQLKAVLKEAAELVQSYTSKGWLKRLAAAGGDAQMFKTLYTHVQDEMRLLSFDLQLTTPAFKDESKSLRALVLNETGKTCDEGGLAELLARADGPQKVRSVLGIDAQVLSAEMSVLAASLARVSRAVDAQLSLSLQRELRGAVMLSVSLTQPTKPSAASGGITFLQQAILLEGFTRTQRRVAAFRVMSGHAVSCTLKVDSKDNTELRVKGIERVDHIEARYEPASRVTARRRCCGGSTIFDGLSVYSDAQLFTDDDVDIPLEAPTQANLTMVLPDDAGPTGEVLTLKLRLWVSFLPAPTLGEAFEQGKTIPVTQTLFFAVFKRGSKRMLMRDIEDEATKHRSGVVALGAPVLALPLLIHGRHLQSTESMLKRQLVGWADGTPLELQ